MTFGDKVIRSLTIFVMSLVVFYVVGLASPAQAYVDWATCQVDSGVVEIANGSVQALAGSTFAFPDPNKTFILSNTSGDNTVTGADDHMVRSAMQSGQYVFQREGSVGVVHVSYQAVYCPNDEFTVYSGTVPITNSNPTASEIIGGGPTGPAVDLGRYFVTASVSTNDPNPDKASGLVRADIDNSLGEYVVLERAAPLAGGPIADVTVNYQVIEFSAESGVVVQHNTAVLFPGDDTAIHLVDQSGINFYDFDPSRTWMYCTWDSDEPGLRQSAIGCNIADGNTVTFHRYASLPTTTNAIRYAVIQFPDNAVFVQRGITSVDPTGNDNEVYNYDIPIVETGSIRRAFSYTTNTTNGTGIEFPRQSWLERLINVVTMRLTFWRSEPVGNSDATNFYWQTIHMGPYYEAQGWGWIGNSPDAASLATPGYISFNCDNLLGYYGTLCGDGTVGNRYDYAVTLEYGGCGITCNVTGQAWVGDFALGESPEYTIGMIDFDSVIDSATYPNSPPTIVGDNITTPENEQLNAHWNPETGELYGWARFRSLRNAENEYATELSASKYDDWGWIQLRGTIDDGSGNEFGVTFDPVTEEFSGWGWSDDGSEPGTGTRLAGSGTGWIKFDLDITTGVDYLATKQGDVYASGDLNVPTPIGEYNATYLIQTSGAITAFTSELDANPPAGAPQDYTPETGAAVIPLPDDNGNLVYRGDLGTLHINELMTTAQEQLHFQTGPCVSSSLLVNTNPLGNQVFYCDGDLTIDTNQVFYNATGDGLGGGTIVVNGNLIIKDNMSYFNYAIASHINNLASVAWIVLGDVIIEPTVKNVVGAFIVLHDPAGNGGEFNTGGGHLQLTVSGLVAASQFTLTRSNVGVAGSPTVPKPSEQIIYDGRVFANIPPGLEDFSKVLPRQ